MSGPTGARPVAAVVAGLDQYQGRLVRGMIPALARHGIPLVVFVNDHQPWSPPSPLLDHLFRHVRPQGVVLSVGTSPADQDHIAGLLGAVDAPAVQIGGEAPDGGSVQGDNVTGMRSLMTHLLDERGARHPVLVRGIPHQPDSTQREDVFRAELARRGLDVDEDLVLDGEFVRERAYAVVLDLARRRRDFDAVVAANDASALGAAAALTVAGLEVPGDVAVTGFDNEPAAALHWPGLTSVDQNLEEQGRAAVELLLDRLRGAGDRRRVIVPSRLVVRGSTASAQLPDEARLDLASAAARAVWDELGRKQPLLRLHSALGRCRTLDDVTRSLPDELAGLGVRRLFLALHEDHEDGTPVAGRSRLVLDYRRRRVEPPPPAVFPTARLLPDDLQPELASGSLVVQPLWILDREIGHVLYEQESGPIGLIWTLRMDVTRALHAVLTRQRLEARASAMQRMVALRTEELETEVIVRRRAEQALQRANAELQESVSRDGLTRVANRAAFQEYLDRCWRGRDGELALLMVDVDLFKPYNDHYGHVRGDETLQRVASCLRHAVRAPEDLVARYGGEEFAVVLPAGGLRAATTVAARFRRLLATQAIPHRGSTVSPTVTASVGIAVRRPAPGVPPATLVAAGDEALYRAKATGRDRVVAVTGSDDGGSPRFEELPMPATPRVPGPRARRAAPNRPGSRPA